MTFDDMVKVVAEIRHADYDFRVTQSYPGVDIFLHVEPVRGVDNATGKPYQWKSRKWRLSRNMLEGEVVQTAFLAVKTAEEHELRERLTYKGETVFNPHFDINALVEFCRSAGSVKERENV